MKKNYNIKILNFRKLSVIPFNDDNPPADLKHISKFSTAWTVEIDSNVGPYVSKKLHVFQYIHEECWLGDYVEESGHAVVTYEEPIELNDDNELVKTGDSYALFAYQPAEEWLGEKDETINYSMWEDEDETEEDRIESHKLYKIFCEIYYNIDPGWDDEFPHDFDETEFTIEIELDD